MKALQQTYISKIRFKNYKSIKNLEIDCHPGLNIIIGQNGSGKTNFVQAIHNVFVAKLHYDLPIGFEFGFEVVSRKHQAWTGRIYEKEVDNPAQKHAKMKLYESKLDFEEPKDGFFHKDILMKFLPLWNFRNSSLEHQLISFGLPTQLQYLDKLDFIEILKLPTGEDNYGELIYDYIASGNNLNYFEPFMRSFQKQMIPNIKKYFKINAELVKHLKQFSPIKDCRISKGYNI
jgi:AAA15 family ATPase/GTPase